MIRDILRDSLIYTIPSFFSRGISFILLPIYTQFLSAEEFGIFDLVLISSILINTVLTFEVSQGLSRYFTETKSQRMKVRFSSTALWFLMLIYFCLCSTGFFFSTTIIETINVEILTLELYNLVLIYFWLFGICSFVHDQLRWEFKTVEFSITSFAVSSITFVSVLYFIYLHEMGLYGVFLGLIAGQAAGCLLGFIYLRKSFPLQFHFSNLKKMLLFSSPLLFSSATVWINSYADRILITEFLSISDLGIYAAGFKLASVVTLVFIGFQSSFAPRLYSNYENPNAKESIKDITRYYFILSMGLFVFIAAVKNIVLDVMVGEEFKVASSTILILVVSIIVGKSYILFPGVFIAKKTMFVVLINVIGMIVNVSLNVFLIPFWGLVGAAVATLISNVLIISLYYFIGQKYYAVNYAWKSLGALSVLSISLFALLNNIEQLSVKLLTVALIFPLGLLALKIISIDEIRSIRKSFLKKG